MREDTSSIFEHVRSEITDAINVTNTKTVVVGLGGSESWAVLLAATDLIGGDKVLAVTAHSTQTDSNIPWQMAALCRGMRIEHCAVDVSRILAETFDARIDLGQIQIEPLHRTMDSLMKAEVMADIRDGMVRAIASRHDSVYLGAISRSKIDRRWGVPAAQSFDWNPLRHHTHHQIKRAIVGRGIGREAADMVSTLDLLPEGGPFPPDLSDDGNIADQVRICRFGLGLFQDDHKDASEEEGE
jgi:hypothetical protein